MMHQVTPQTIRRDLNEMCARGLLARVHGGAVPARGVSNLAYEDHRLRVGILGLISAMVTACGDPCIDDGFGGGDCPTVISTGVSIIRLQNGGTL